MSYMIKTIVSKFTRPLSARAVVVNGSRAYSVRKQVDQRDWMDAEESQGYVQEAIRSINEETINSLAGSHVHTIGAYRSQEEESITPSKLVRKDWMNTTEDYGYAQEAIRAVLQDTIHNPVGSNIHSIGSSIDFEQSSSEKSSKVTQPLKADWLDAEDFHLVIEAIRAFKSDTVNSLSLSPVLTAAQKLT
ncbi:hypothetical protein K7432_016223 [Basidiobolus ranarum]|uniref:Uncharacterized protein n=1 Tax=Basidiobolus ranarum TaxID=34480 RepID=A0ABR2WF51_9FUNG